MHTSWQSELEVFSPAECQSLVQEFFSYEHTDENKMPEYYRNSFGYYNLPGSLAFVDRTTKIIKDRYPQAVFSNTYTRVYNRHSVLNLHTDRKGLDLTLSVCLEDKNNLDWPLNISAKTYAGEEWDLKEDPTKYKSVDLSGFHEMIAAKATLRIVPKVEVATSNDPAIVAANAA